METYIINRGELDINCTLILINLKCFVLNLMPTA